MEFPEVDFRNENACFETLFKLVHADGLHCPRCREDGRLVIHKHHGPSWIVDYQCQVCHRVFNAWTDTVFEKTHHPPSRILQIIQGRPQGASKVQLARELDCHRGSLATQIDHWQGWMTSKFGPPPHKKHSTLEASTRRQTARRKARKSRAKTNPKPVAQGRSQSKTPRQQRRRKNR